MTEILLITFGTLGLACGVLAVILIIKHFFSLYMREDLELKKVALDQSETAVELVEEIKTILKNQKMAKPIAELVNGSVSSLKLGGIYHYEQLLDVLFKAPGVTGVTEYSDAVDGYGTRNVVVKVTREDGSFYLLKAACETTSDKRNVKYHLNGVEVAPETLIVHSLFIVTPNKDCGEDCRIISYADLKKTVIDAAVTEVWPERPETERTVYRLMSEFESVYFAPDTFEANSIPANILGLSYAPIKISSGGVNYAVPVDKLNPLITNTLAGKKNVVILGPSGAGKTTLISHTIENHPGAVILLDLPSLPVFAGPSGQAAFRAFCARHNDILIVLDEAQGLTPEQETYLLTLMNNGLSIKKKKTSLLVALNATKNEVSAPLINTNRCHMLLELEYLSKTRAMNLIQELEKDPTLRVDNAQFIKIVDGTSSFSGAAKLANTISLSDIFHCVKPMEETDMLKDKLALYKV